MPGVAVTQMDGLPDVLGTFRYVVSFPTLPGINGQVNIDVLNVLCQNIEWPGSTIEQMQAQTHGFTHNYAGRVTHTHTMTANFYENSAMQVQKTIGAWKEYVRGTVSGDSGGTKHGGPAGGNQLSIVSGGSGGYAVDVEIGVLDTTGRIAGIALVKNMFPQDRQAVTMDGASSSAFLKPWQFSFDYVIEVAGTTNIPGAIPASILSGLRALGL